MSGGGGKGGGSTQKQEIPAWAREPTKRNLARAETAQQVGYMPYIGPDIAAYSPTQMAVRQNAADAASAFGLAVPRDAQQTGLPEPTQFTGQDGSTMFGYSAFPLYDQAVAEFKRRDPNQAAIYDKLFGDQNPQGRK